MNEALHTVHEAMAQDRQLGDVRHLTSVRRFKLALLFEVGRYRECVLQADTLLTLARGRAWTSPEAPAFGAPV